MSPVTAIMVVFSMLAAADRILGNRFGLGKEFEKGLMLLGNMALSMIGMIVISPLIARLLEPVFGFVSGTLGIEPSIIPAALFANDMGGAPLAKEIAVDERMGMFNGLVVSSMMGCTVSFTIPYALGVVEERQHRPLLLGMLCGIVTIPVGCFAGGLWLRLPLGALVMNLLPLVLFSALIALGLSFCPERCVRIFRAFGSFIKAVITLGLALAILRFLTGIELIKGLGTLEDGAAVCLNAAAVMTGAFPLIALVSRLLAKTLKKLGEKIGINETSAMGLLCSLASNMTMFAMMKDMDDKGVLFNAAFTISAVGAFASHLAFTMAFDSAYLPAMIVGKLSAALLALGVSALLCRKGNIFRNEPA